MILILGNKMGRSVLELVGKAIQLSEKSGMKVGVFLIGGRELENAERLLDYGVDQVFVASDERLERFVSDVYLRISERVIKYIDPEIILSPADTFGRSLMPMIAAKLETGLTADCTDLDFDEKGNFLQTRPAIGGNIMATIVIPNHRPKMATVRPRTFSVARKIGRKRDAEIEFLKIPDEYFRSNVRLLSFKEKRDEINIQEADVIVAAGKGLRRKENMEIVRELAELVGGAVGASRAIVDAKWISHDHQVGLSGKTVKPKVYIAAGISGAVQHIAGMQTSEMIIAINKDKFAPIFKVADIGIVADAKSTLEEIIRRLRSR